MRLAARVVAVLSLAMLAPPVSADPPPPTDPGTRPAIPPATIDEALEIEGESIAARLARTRLSVGVTVNGGGPYRFLVDSGADRTVIGAALSQALQLPPMGRVTLHSTSGTETVATVRIDTLGVGRSRIDAIAAPALPERFLGAQGILGIDALADQRLMLDFDARTITVQDTRSRSAPIAEADEIVVSARRRNGQLILTQASANGVRIHALVDSGSEVTIGNTALRNRLFARGRLPPTTPVSMISVTGGSTTADSIVVPQITIGGIALSDVPIAFDDAPPFALFGLADQPAILLGTDLLSVFRRVSLDFRARKLRFQLRRR